MKFARKFDRPGPATLLGCILLFSVTAAACRGNGEARFSGSREQGSPGLEALTVLKIREHVFSGLDFDKYVRSLIGSEEGVLTAPALSRLFDDFVDEQFLLLAARDQNLSLTPGEKQEFVDRWNKDTFSHDKEGFEPGDSMDHFFDKMLIERYLNRLAKDIRVGDQEVAAYYEAHEMEFQVPVRVKVSQILVRTEPIALEVLEQIQNKGEDEFRAAVRKESVGPEAAEGGRMGFFQEGQLPREMDRTVFSLQEGELSRALKSADGYHIFRVDKKYNAELTPLEKAAPAIRLKILEGKVKEARDTHLRELKANTEWKSFIENLPFVYQKENS